MTAMLNIAFDQLHPSRKPRMRGALLLIVCLPLLLSACAGDTIDGTVAYPAGTYAYDPYFDDDFAFDGGYGWHHGWDHEGWDHDPGFHGAWGHGLAGHGIGVGGMSAHGFGGHGFGGHGFGGHGGGGGGHR